MDDWSLAKTMRRTGNRGSEASATFWLDEARHRHANELANAVACLHLVRARSRSPEPLIDRTIARLESQARLDRLLAAPATDQLAYAMFQLAELISAARHMSPNLDLTADSARIGCETTMKTMLLLAYELTTNALKRAPFDGPPVTMTVKVSDRTVRLVVANEIADERSGTSEGGLGLGLVRRMTASLGGSFARTREGERHVARVAIPIGQASRRRPPTR